MIAAAIQLNSGEDRAKNLARSAELLAEAAEKGAELALLPENFAYMGGDEAAKRAMAEPVSDSSVIRFLQEQAALNGMTIIGGGLLLHSDDGRIRNSSVAVAASGEVQAIYDKIHLFDVDVNGDAYRESDVVAPGAEPVSFELQLSDMNSIRVGMSICYDLRFPELYRHYAMQACHLLTVPAAFTYTTGKSHWLPLLQARAIENQCYVIAAGQSGMHPGGRQTWGHSMVIDPWGEVLSLLDEGEGVVVVSLSLSHLDEVRAAMPVLLHSRLF